MPEAFKILVVDDEPDLEPLVLQRMRRRIRAGQYSFVFAHNGVEALDVLRQEDDIDMVISDINMPQMDGLTLLEQIPKVDPNVRSIIISAYGDMKNIRTAMNRGAFDFVTKPLDFDDLQLTIDRTLAHLVEWREALSSRDRLVSLENELNVAAKIQQSILPTEFPRGSDYAVFASMEPAREVGGDFYDIISLDNERIGVAIADVSDKGVPAALFMMSSRTLLKGSAIGTYEPGDVLKEVNDILCEGNEAMMFVTLLYAIYDTKNGKLTYANGGHTTPYVRRADGTVIALPFTGGIAIGVLEDLEYSQDSFEMLPGDAAFFYSDGVSEAMNSEGEEFGLERMAEVLANTPSQDPMDINEAMFAAVRAFAGNTPQSDDITCLTLCRGGAT
ncbi:MAG: SpoIIE family protein phosphatase [Chloroflexota bacterium]|nr:SpoIIE family protein phosphatase [Chloroflexota bacterium]MDE2844012.1 SpoIIE family protein phosphatase [Chloroflexota bacterium]